MSKTKYAKFKQLLICFCPKKKQLFGPILKKKLLIEKIVSPSLQNNKNNFHVFNFQPILECLGTIWRWISNACRLAEIWE